MLDSLPILSTKFHIPLSRTDLVPRVRLMNLLEDGARQPLTLISAPPGFGKTTLVANWLLNREQASSSPPFVGWLSLDESDDYPAVFWRYLVAALQRAHGGLGETAQSMLSAPRPPELETMIVALINDIAGLSVPFVLVLDDYHLIQNSAIHAGLNFLLDHQPPNFHLLLLTREDPPLALARRRARRQLVEIRAGDLRFSPDETAAFLNSSMGLGLTAEQIAALEQHTEGWIVGLQMAALSLQGRDPGTFFQSFAGDNRYIADYLIEEVLQRQPETVRTFLLKTSILERMCDSLCAALFDDAAAGNSQGELSSLERSNLFIIPLDDQREWYRYHHLFAELLQQRLRHAYSVPEVANLHRRASQWFETRQDIPSAVHHARLIPDTEAVINLLERHAGSFFFQSDLPRYYRWVNEVPAVLRESHPALCMAAAWAAVATNHPDEARAWLNAIERHFGLGADAALNDASLPTDLRAALLEVLVLRLQSPLNNLPAMVQRRRIEQILATLETLAPDQGCLFNTIMTLKPVVTFDVGLVAEMSDDMQAAARAFSEAINLSREVKNTHIFQLALGHLANIQVQQGNLSAASDTHELALAQAESIGKAVSPFIAIAHAGLGSIAYERNDLASADRHFNAALPLARAWNQWDVLIPTILGLAHLKHALGDEKAALSILDEWKASPQPELFLPIAVYRARLLFETGKRDEAALWLQNSGLSPQAEPNSQNESVLLELGGLLAHFNRKDEALNLIRKILQAATLKGHVQVTIRAQVLLAKLLGQEGQLDEAQKNLTEAARRAAPKGCLRPFIDEGQTIRRLLEENRAKDVKIFIGQVLQGFGRDATTQAVSGPAIGMTEALSEREGEVLQLVAEGLSNRGIANRLVISVTTVKTHVGNIFLKLGVTSRTQAIARAEALGLLPRR
jgi:LuxR family maltose regulon positive regulatory protein